MPVKFCGTLDVATLPLFLNEVRHFSSWHTPFFRQVMLVPNHEDRDIVHVPTLKDLIPEGLDILEAFFGRDVVDKDVGCGVSEAISAEVCPLVQRIDWKVRNVWTIDYLQFIQVIVDDYRWTKDFFLLSWDVILGELVAHKLSYNRTLANSRRAKYSKFDTLKVRIYCQMARSHDERLSRLPESPTAFFPRGPLMSPVYQPRGGSTPEQTICKGWA